MPRRATGRRASLGVLLAAGGSALAGGCASAGRPARPRAARARTRLSCATLNAGLWPPSGTRVVIGRRIGVTAGLARVAQRVTGLDLAEQVRVAREASAPFAPGEAEARSARKRLPGMFASAG